MYSLVTQLHKSNVDLNVKWSIGSYLELDVFDKLMEMFVSKTILTSNISQMFQLI